MTSDGAPPLPGPDTTLTPGAARSPFTALPVPPSALGPPEQPPWERPPQPPLSSALCAGPPLMLSPFPNPLLVMGDGGPGHSGAEAGKVIVKLKKEVGAAESSQIQNFILAQTAHSWIAAGAPCGGPEGPSPQFVTASNVNTLLPTDAAGMSQEGLPGLPAQALPPAAHLVPIVSPEKTWPGPHVATGEGNLAVIQSKPALSNLSCTSKGVYENFRRWQCYKALARRHFPQSPDTEALSCFFIPVLRSLSRLKPAMTLEEGLPRAVHEWDHTSNFDRMTFYEMAEKFMEFEAEEEMLNQNTQLMSGPQGLPPAAPLKLDPQGPQAPEVCPQPVYIPRKSAFKARTPRRRQRKTQKPPVPQAPKEIPPEAVKEYTDIMEGLVGGHLATGESDGSQEEEEQQPEEGMYPGPDLLSYIDELCSQEGFVAKVEAVLHPQFLANLLSSEQQRDPLALMEELEQEEGLSVAQLVQKRLLALEEEEGAEASPSCSGAHLDASPSVSDEDEDGGGRLRVAGGAVCLGKAASQGKQATLVHGEQEQALDGPRGACRDGGLPSPSSWDLHTELAAPQGTREPLGAEIRGPGEEVTDRVSPPQDDYLGGAGSPGHFQVADGTCEALCLCWQESSQFEIVPTLDVGLAELAPLQGQGLEKQVLELEMEEQIGGLGVLSPGQGLLVVPRGGSPGVMWGDDGGPPMDQSSEQSFSPEAAEYKDEDGDSFSPGLWLSREMDAIGLELPLPIEEVTENFHDWEHVPEHQGGCQALGSRSNIPLGPGETTVSGDGGGGAVPCGGAEAAVALERRNCGLASRLREQSPETIQDPSDLWAGGCPLLLDGSLDASTLISKDTLLPACPGSIFILGTQDASAFPEASQEAGSRGVSLSESTEHSHVLDARDGCGLQVGVSEDTCPLNFTSHEPQREGGEDADLLNPKDLAPLPGNRKSYAHGTPKSASVRGLGKTSRRWGARGAVVPKAPPAGGAGSASGRAKRKEDEELCSVACLLASKLSLSPGQTSLSPHPGEGLSSTGQGVQSAHPLSAEATSPGPSPCPAAKSRKRAPAVGPVPAGEMPYPGAKLVVSGEKPLARPLQPRKRRRDSSGTGRKKKSRRSQ